MRAPPLQAILPFNRKERVRQRQWRQRAEGKKVTPGPGRPKSKHAGVSHQRRPLIAEKSAVHVTVKANKLVPNLRSRRRFSVIKNAFVKFCAPKGAGFRLVHFSVLSNHVHFVVEADSKRALSMGMQKLLHSISRRLNALSVKEHGARLSTKGGSYSALKGWLGRVFSDRYHAHLLKTPTEIAHAVRYVLQNAEHHHVRHVDDSRLSADPFTSVGAADHELTVQPRGFLLIKACKSYLQQRSRQAR